MQPMKLRLSLLFSLVSLPLWAAPVAVAPKAVSATAASSATVQAAVPAAPVAPVRLVYDMSGLPLTLTRDGAGTVMFDGLPYPGDVLYQPATGTLFYHHPEEAEWISVPPAALEALYVSSTVTGGGKWQPWQGNTTQQWDVKSGTTVCDQWYASTALAQQTGLNVADVLRVLVGVQWLNGGTVPDACEKIRITAADAAKVGLPVLFTGPNGRWQLQEVVKEPVEKIALPKAAPVDDETRLRLLLVQFSPEERSAMLTQFAGKTTQEQIEAISDLLNQDATP